MKRMIYLTAMALLGIGLTLAQNTKPSSDPSNSSNTSTQAQSATSTPDSKEKAPDAGPSAHRHRGQGEPSTSAVPDPTVRDQQSSTISTPDAAGQNNNQPSTMGTIGSSPATSDQMSEPKKPATLPQNGTPPDRQPNSSTGPDAASLHTEFTPPARAVSTHTPDPGTCMNPAALQTTADGSEPNKTPPCR